MSTKTQLSRAFKTIVVDVEDVYKAIDKNGLEHIRESWIQTNEDGTQKACVLGQGALNLGVVHASFDGDDLYGFQNIIDKFVDSEGMLTDDGETVYGLMEFKINKYSLDTQLDKFRVPKSSKWSIKGQEALESNSDRAGHTIIYWNDKNDGTGHYDKNYNWIVSNYTLKTYAEVTAMAFDILNPHFGKKVELLTYDFDYQVPTMGAISA